MADEVVIVGAGPAGSVAATVLARAGVRVRLVDRTRFPRHKLCGDTINPGSLAMLRRLRLADAADASGLPIDGMVVTGEGGVCIEGRYPRSLQGRAISRHVFDRALVDAAIAAGAAFEDEVAVREAVLTTHEHAPVVAGVKAGANGQLRELRAPVTIAADGRHSTIAFGLGLAMHPQRPRRWAVGAYFDGAAGGRSSIGEMHIRRGRYIGIAPVPGGITNVCLVVPPDGSAGTLRDPLGALRGALAREPGLRDRFAGARAIGMPTVLGPLAVNTGAASPPDGLLLAGDASGFIDPMTGDGLRFAIRGGELAAEAAIDALTHGWAGVHVRLRARRQQEFSGKWRFNRVLRAMVGSPLAVRGAGLGARLSPALVRALIARAADCDLAERL